MGYVTLTVRLLVRYSLWHKETNTALQSQSHHHHAEHSSNKKAVSKLGPQRSQRRIQQDHMFKTHFTSIKETVAALIWRFISFVIMGYGRDHGVTWGYNHLHLVNTLLPLCEDLGGEIGRERKR